MSFKIIRNDITKVRADAIVNTAKPMPVIGSGTDAAVYTAAGSELLLEARKKIGVIDRGESRATESFDLKKNGVKYIIHTVGIRWKDGNSGEKLVLKSCYSNSLNLAKKLGCKSIAIPLLCSGNYGYPKSLALDIGIEQIENFLLENEDIDVTLVVYDRKSFEISEQLGKDVQSFIDENYINVNKEIEIGEYISQKSRRNIDARRARATGINNDFLCLESESIAAPVKCSSLQKPITPIDIDAFIEQQQDTKNFAETLQKMIADRNLANAEIYKKANIDRKYFSKIINTKDYVPKKQTVMALGLALNLPLKEYEAFLASAGYAFMPSEKFDVIIKYCVINKIYNLMKVDTILFSQNVPCFSS